MMKNAGNLPVKVSMSVIKGLVVHVTLVARLGV